tara:strand:- start:609 stop:818 length:210 start_codon:yes stop_codon:yes gene_type:complete
MASRNTTSTSAGDLVSLVVASITSQRSTPDTGFELIQTAEGGKALQQATATKIQLRVRGYIERSRRSMI